MTRKLPSQKLALEALASLMPSTCCTSFSVSLMLISMVDVVCSPEIKNLKTTFLGVLFWELSDSLLRVIGGQEETLDGVE